MPQLDEGSILVETRKLPGISLTDSVEISKRIEQKLRTFPEIADVVIKIGRPDFATEAMGINEGDTYLLLRLMHEWHRFHGKEELIYAIDKELAKIPGLSYNFTQPMAMRVDESVSGVKADLAIKIFGDDFDMLASLSQQVLRAVSSVRGAADPQIQLTSGVPDLTIRIDRSALARYGLNVPDVQEAVEAGASGAIISQLIDGQKRYDIAMRLPASFRANPQTMQDITLLAPGGAQVKLAQVRAYPPPMDDIAKNFIVTSIRTSLKLCDKQLDPWFDDTGRFDPNWIVDPLLDPDPPMEIVDAQFWKVKIEGLDPRQSASLIDETGHMLAHAISNRGAREKGVVAACRISQQIGHYRRRRPSVS